MLLWRRNIMLLHLIIMDRHLLMFGLLRQVRSVTSLA